MNGIMMLDFLKEHCVHEMVLSEKYNPVLPGKRFIFNEFQQELREEKEESSNNQEDKPIFAIYAELDEETSCVVFTVNCDENYVVAVVPLVKLMKNGIKVILE